MGLQTSVLCLCYHKKQTINRCKRHCVLEQAFLSWSVNLFMSWGMYALKWTANQYGIDCSIFLSGSHFEMHYRVKKGHLWSGLFYVSYWTTRCMNSSSQCPHLLMIVITVCSPPQRQYSVATKTRPSTSSQPSAQMTSSWPAAQVTTTHTSGRYILVFFAAYDYCWCLWWLRWCT